MTTTCVHCGKTWGGYRPEHCTVCHETFTGTEAGDAHRVGDFEDGTRRCLSTDEMRVRVKSPLTQDHRGLWQVARARRTPPPWSAIREIPADQAPRVPTEGDAA